MGQKYLALRNPKTAQERRAIGEYSRAKRSGAKLVNNRYDKTKSEFESKSWKKSKKKAQWA